MKWNKIRHFSMAHIQIWLHIFFFYRNILKYFNDFQYLNFSVLLLKLTQTIKMKENQTFFHVTYSNLTTYLFSSKNIKVFEWLLNRTFWVLWLKWTQTMEMKQSQTFFHRTFLNLTLFSLVVKYQNISVISIISTRLRRLEDILGWEFYFKSSVLNLETCNLPKSSQS